MRHMKYESDDRLWRDMHDEAIKRGVSDAIAWPKILGEEHFATCCAAYERTEAHSSLCYAVQHGAKMFVKEMEL